MLHLNFFQRSDKLDQRFWWWRVIPNSGSAHMPTKQFLDVEMIILRDSVKLTRAACFKTPDRLCFLE